MPNLVKTPPALKKTRRRLMVPFEYEFAEWMAGFIKTPTLGEQTSKLSELGEKDLGRQYLRTLKASNEYCNYYRLMLQGALAKARAIWEKDAPLYIDAHREGLEMAKEEGDFKAIVAFTKPAIDRVHPIKEDNVAVANITIQLTQKRQDVLTEELPEVEYEVIEDDDSDE